MARIFISYAHHDKEFTDSFVTAVREFYRRQNVAVWYDEDLRGGDHWWREIMRQLFRTDIFIYLMSMQALNSPYCQAEFREAYRLRKQIITVQVDEQIKIDDPLLSAIQYVDLSRGIEDGRQIGKFFSALNEQLGRVPPVRLLPPRSWKRTLQPPNPDKSANATVGNERVLRQPMDINTRLAYIQTIFAGIGIVLTMIGLVFAYIAIIPIIQNWRSQTPIPPTIGGLLTAVPTPVPSTQPPPDVSFVLSPTATPADINDLLQLTLTSEFEQTATANAPTVWASATQAEIARQLNATETEVARQTALQQQLNDSATAFWLSQTPPTPTPTPTATLTALEQAIERARTFTGTRNADWQPFSYVFADGVERVLVPVGCFRMGSNNGENDEQPVHEQCVTEPFWLDKYEVTNALYGPVGCSDWSSEADQPRNCVDWLDAQAFCEARGGTLPSEMQWEYAARGVESWVYPWGNDYDAERVIGADDPTYGSRQTAPVGSRPDGASWVGAMDISGNLWEWIHTRYDPYPYEESDNGYNNGDIRNRVLRGGSFSYPASYLRSANRDHWNPTDSGNLTGFRCAFSLNSPDL